MRFCFLVAQASALHVHDLAGPANAVEPKRVCVDNGPFVSLEKWLLYKCTPMYSFIYFVLIFRAGAGVPCDTYQIFRMQLLFQIFLLPP